MISIREIQNESNISRIENMRANPMREYIFILDEKNHIDVEEEILRKIFTDLKVVKIRENILCVYKGEISNPREYFSEILPCRHCPPDHW